MTLPFMLGATMVGTAAAGAVGAAGDYEQGQAQKNMMLYQQKAAQIQAQQTAEVAKANISGVQNQSALEATMLARKQMEQTGQQKAAEGAQGIGSSGTAADIAKSTFTKHQMDQQVLQYNANVKSWGITNQANQKIWALGTEANQYGLGAETSAESGAISAGSSLLSTASQVGTEAVMGGTKGIFL